MSDHERSEARRQRVEGWTRRQAHARVIGYAVAGVLLLVAFLVLAGVVMPAGADLATESRATQIGMLVLALTGIGGAIALVGRGVYLYMLWVGLQPAKSARRTAAETAPGAEDPDRLS